MQKITKFSTLLGYGALALTGGIMLASAVATDAQARGPHGGMGERVSFEQLDTDGNGALSQAELQARGEVLFNSADTNGDGKLSVEEMVAARSSGATNRAERAVERLDTDGDGALSQEELLAGRETRREDRREDRQAKRFERMDADGSGDLSQAEFEAAGERFGNRGNRGDK